MTKTNHETRNYCYGSRTCAGVHYSRSTYIYSSDYSFDIIEKSVLYVLLATYKD